MKCYASYAKPAWEYVGTSKLLLSEYLNVQNMVCTDAEIDSIFAGLKALPYNTPEVSFKASIQTFIENISYERNKQQLLSLWKERSGENTVGDWCKRHTTPIQWVLDEASLQHVLLVKTLNDGKKVDSTQLRYAVDFFEQSSFNSLRDAELIKSRFLSQIGDSSVAAFLESRDDILARIRMKLGADVFAWGYKAGEMRNVIEAYIREKNAAKYRETAKTSVMKMPETDLRERVIALLEQHPEYCKLFLDSEG